MNKKYKIKDFLEIKYATGASFSPNGKKVTFLSNITGVNQLYLTNQSGKGTKQLTDYKDSIIVASFSPVKDEIIFSKGKGGNEKNQLYIFNLISKKVRFLTNKPNFIYKWGGWSKDGKFITYSSNERNGIDFDIYIMNIKNRNTSMIFKGSGWCDALGFSPTGKKVTVRKLHTYLNHDLYIIDLKTKEKKLLTSHKGKSVYGIPQWLPDESGFFFISEEGRDLTCLTFYDLNKNKRKNVLELNYGLDFDHDDGIDGVSISPDGKNLALILNNNGQGKLSIYKTNTLKIIENKLFSDGIVDYLYWSNDSKYLAYSYESPLINKDIWIWSKNDNKCYQITKSPCNIPKKVLTVPELIYYKSFDGLKIPAYLFLPKKKKDKFPVIINIHGGPESQYRPGLSSNAGIDLLVPYLVYHGYAVISPNIRGSTGFGKKYSELDNIKKRKNALKDLYFLYKYLEKKPEIDNRKIALMGASYGGYMTLLGLTFYPDLWAAGVDVVGLSNVITFLQNISTWRRAIREVEYGSLKSDKKFLKLISPRNYIKNIKAPLFIIHGVNDPRVPPSESKEIYQKMNKNGQKVKLLIYKDEGHGLRKLKNKLDAYPKIVDFLDQYLN